ncbi:MAG: hypothetical protein O2843_06500 [Chloroflexi bacterium]|nr:hypothetical protein [Chloroflexota bacterium]
MTGRQMWRRTRLTLVNMIVIFGAIQLILRLEALPLPVRLVLLVLVSLLLTALVSLWFYRAGDEDDRVHIAREWAWARWLWRRARLRGS